MNMFPIKTLCVLKKYRQSSTFVLLCLFFREKASHLGVLREIFP